MKGAKYNFAGTRGVPKYNLGTRDEGNEAHEFWEGEGRPDGITKFTKLTEFFRKICARSTTSRE
jgi:hypothetical protein